MSDVSWHDANAYAEWLSVQTGQRYRLPTSVEWEYAARAGATTAFAFGEEIGRAEANYAETFHGGPTATGRLGPPPPRWAARAHAVRVGWYKANAFGLYDVHGNVSERTCSDYAQHEGCAGADQEGVRVLRGGSWRDTAGELAFSSSDAYLPEYHSSTIGFRLLRELH